MRDSFPRSRQSPCTEGVWQLGRDILEKTAELDFVYKGRCVGKTWGENSLH